MPKTPSQYKLVLGFDFGMKHIGVATGQVITFSASPLTSIRAQDGIPDWVTLEKIVAQWQPDAFIVGIPLHIDGSNAPITPHAERFAKRIQKHFHLPTEQIDERLSTVEAKRQLLAEHGYKNITKQQIDSYAAKIIIETWFAEFRRKM